MLNVKCAKHAVETSKLTSTKKFKQTVLAAKIMALVFWIFKVVIRLSPEKVKPSLAALC